MKKWRILHQTEEKDNQISPEDIIRILLTNRKIESISAGNDFLHPREPEKLQSDQVGIDPISIGKVVARLVQAVQKHESIVVYADYDADGITAGSLMWEALHNLGATVMPYIPHRVDEGYGLSIKGIDTVIKLHHPALIITVDHGVTAKSKIAYAMSKGVDVVVTDHHVLPDDPPECLMVHTTMMSGAGIAWFVVKELYLHLKKSLPSEFLALAAIGTIADLVPLVGPNRSIAKYGLQAINSSSRIGLQELIHDAGLVQGNLGTYEVSHILAPRLNAMGRIEHAMDALRLLCTTSSARARELAVKLGLTNKERQQLTIDTVLHAKNLLPKKVDQKLIFISDPSYNQGVIGLVAGKLVEEFYRPSVVVSIGELYSKASARSISGFNIVEAIKSCSDILVDVGGHPMAAGFTVETKNLSLLQDRLEQLAENQIEDSSLVRSLNIDVRVVLSVITEKLWTTLQSLEPFGFGNIEPVFASYKVKVVDARLVGNEGKHLKLKVATDQLIFDAIAFGFGGLSGQIKSGQLVDLAYTIDMNEWNGRRSLQLKVKDIQI